ncbi:tetratricopeptide repeat protein [Methanobacterium sp. MBAC-LM]|jgi:tetratricopeptide (TPR) repeat protein|uniref:tetratricopeptide repeat protein n=1 Tax=Methanobacterium sp. MBAC-LM TaxID=3412034 RepID=UPI003C710521
MDIITLLGAMCLAYGGMLILYYRLRTTEKRKELSYLMLNGIKSMRRGNLDKALIYFDRAYEYTIETGNREEMADALYNMGIIYKEKGEMGSAMEYLNSALSVYDELQDKDGSKKVTVATRSIR